MLKALLYLWELPQNIVGLILTFIFKSRKPFAKANNRNIYAWNIWAGISLGHYIFMPKDKDDALAKHEYGHTRQSIVLGPLYLILIGLPSIIWAGIIYPRTSFDYEDFFIESMATKLGKNAKITYLEEIK